MRILVRILVGVALIGTVYAAAQVNWSNLDARGVVQDYVTKRPVPGAKMTLDCRESHYWYGTKSIRTVHTVSSEDGRYSFRFADSWDCDYVVLTPEKQGYKNLFGLGIPDMFFGPFSARVPKHSWLVAEGDEARLRLEGWLQRSRAVRLSAPGPLVAMENYLSVAVPFDQSRRIATEPRDIVWVRSQYCERLADLYAKTSTLERERIANASHGGVDYEIHVRPYCRPGVKPGPLTDPSYLGR